MSLDVFANGVKLKVTTTIAANKVTRIVFGFLFCKNLIKAPKIIASTAEEIAPINISAELFLSIPSNINEPSPPAPISAARVAVPIIIILAVLTPPIKIGIDKAS